MSVACGKFVQSHENAYGEFFSDVGVLQAENTLKTSINIRENWLLDYDGVSGIAVYTYVMQNPWSGFDPNGLETISLKEAFKNGTDIRREDWLRIRMTNEEVDKVSKHLGIEKSLTTQKEVRKDIVRKGFFGRRYIIDRMLWPNENTAYYKDWKSGSSINDVVSNETARRNYIRVKREIWRLYGNQTDKKKFQIMWSLYEIASLSTLPLNMANPTAASTALARNTKKVGGIAGNVLEGSPGSFTRTHGLSGRRSSKNVNQLTDSMKSNGWQGAPIKVFEHNGARYILDGHHRQQAAMRAGLTKMPYEKVPAQNLSQYGYNSADEVIRAATEAGPVKLRK